MKNLFIFIFLFITAQLKSQTPDWEWARSGQGVSEGIGTALDAQSNLYISGFFMDTLIFGSDTLTGGNAALSGFIAKYDSTGNLQWAKSDSGASASAVCYGYHVCTDHFGNSYFSGYFLDTIYFDSHVLISNGGSDIFLVKYDSSGNVCWAKHAGGTTMEQGLGVTADITGNIYLTGFFCSPTMSFGSSILSNLGISNIFIAKYDSSGNELWAISAGSSLVNDAFAIATDALGNVYVTGYFTSPFIFFGTDTIFNTGDHDFFLAKYDSTGNAIWAKGASGSDFDKGNSVSIDNYGNIYVTGFFSSPLIIFDSYMLTNSSANNTFLVKYNSLGNVLWAKNINGASNVGYHITTDNSDKIYLSGSMGMGDSSIIYFDTLALQSLIGATDPMFIACYDSSGISIFAKALTSGGDDWSSITVSSTGSIYVGGDFYQINPFILGNDSMPLVGEENVFIAKLSYSSSVGISEVNLNNGCNLYPNPFQNELTISVNNHEPVEVILYDLTSRILLQQKFTNSTTLNTQHLANGMYMYEVRNKGVVIKTGKVVKD